MDLLLTAASVSAEIQVKRKLSRLESNRESARRSRRRRRERESLQKHLLERLISDNIFLRHRLLQMQESANEQQRRPSEDLVSTGNPFELEEAYKGRAPPVKHRVLVEGRVWP